MSGQRPAGGLADLLDALRAEQIRGCPDRLGPFADTPKLCALRRTVLMSALCAADTDPPNDDPNVRHLRLTGPAGTQDGAA
jgi:hypothetical protein